MAFCSVPGCQTEKYRLHKFPLIGASSLQVRLGDGERIAMDRRDVWKKILKISKVSSKMAVCSRHFRGDDYHIVKKGEISRMRLRPEAVPSQNLPIRVSKHCDILVFYEKQAEGGIKSKTKLEINTRIIKSDPEIKQNNEISTIISEPEAKEENDTWIIKSEPEIRCCVYGCLSTKQRNPDLYFHQFPLSGEARILINCKNNKSTWMDRRDVWRVLLSKARVHVSNRVCSRHFPDSDYIEFDSGMELKINACPRHFLPQVKQEEVQHSEPLFFHEAKRHLIKPALPTILRNSNSNPNPVENPTSTKSFKPKNSSLNESVNPSEYVMQGILNNPNPTCILCPNKASTQTIPKRFEISTELISKQKFQPQEIENSSRPRIIEDLTRPQSSSKFVLTDIEIPPCTSTPNQSMKVEDNFQLINPNEMIPSVNQTDELFGWTFLFEPMDVIKNMPASIVQQTDEFEEIKHEDSGCLIIQRDAEKLKNFVKQESLEHLDEEMLLENAVKIEYNEMELDVEEEKIKEEAIFY